jgi:hypothetical protein
MFPNAVRWNNRKRQSEEKRQRFGGFCIKNELERAKGSVNEAWLVRLVCNECDEVGGDRAVVLL